MTLESFLQILGPTLITAAIAYLGLRKSGKVDKAAIASGAVANHRASWREITEGLRGLIKELQDDNENFRKDLLWATDRLDAVTAERDALRLEVARLRKKYGENGDTPQPPNKGTQ